MTDKGGGLAELPEGAPQPAQARTPTEFTAALRSLRILSGLTYRQLEDKATAHADSLPASTIATALSRSTLPREAFVVAFTRACGLAEDDIRQWREARQSLAMAQRAPVPRADPDVPGLVEPVASDKAGSDGRSTSVRWVGYWHLSVAAILGAGVALGVGALVPTSSSPEGTATSTHLVDGLDILTVGSWAQIKPARTPGLCVAEGRDRTNRYPTAVAAQVSCAKAVPPRTYIEPVGENLIQIHWHHPGYRIGCLTLVGEGPGRSLIEPKNECSEDNPAQQFRIDPSGPPDSARFRLRSAANGRCLAIRGQDTTAGAEVALSRCSGTRDQEFLVILLSPP
ncbi:XRE family transcriptional regulator [Streptomyces sp. NPDC048290]|uniref:XRE family transcriptional regulator n=1 Tax=Streptomyces sp. NPDC048290 TaxID=3155811 RepID=UPI0034159E6A